MGRSQKAKSAAIAIWTVFSVALSPNLAGAIFMMLSMAGFTLNDVLVKHVSTGMNMGQIMLVRGFFATVLIGLLAWHQGALRAPRRLLHPLVQLRAACELGGTALFLLAL